MTYTTKSCPHCGFKYQIMDPVKHHYGSPFQTCRKCKNTFIDKDNLELACADSSEHTAPCITGASILWLVGGLLFLIIDSIMSSAFSYTGLIGIGIAAFLIFSDLKSYPERSAWLAEELHNSKERMSDPYYVIALTKIGYKVPEKFKIAALQAIEKQYPADQISDRI